MYYQSYLTTSNVCHWPSAILSKIEACAFFDERNRAPITEKCTEVCLYRLIISVLQRTCPSYLTSTEENRIWQVILLKNLFPKTTLHQLPANAHFKRKDKKGDLARLGNEYRMGTSFLTDDWGDLYALTKLYINASEVKGTRYKKLRLAIRINSVSLYVVYSNQKNEFPAYQQVSSEIKNLRRLAPSDHLLQILHSSTSAHRIRYMTSFSLQGNFFSFLINFKNQFANDTNEQKRCLRFFQEILYGVQEIHQKGILHNDLKADNILILHDKAEIMDFECATTLSEQEKIWKKQLQIWEACGREGIPLHLAGFEEYIAPERYLIYAYLSYPGFFQTLYQNEAREEVRDHLICLSKRLNQWRDLLTPASDLWAIGMIFYYAANNNDSFDFFKRGSNVLNSATYATMTQAEFNLRAFSNKDAHLSPFLRLLNEMARYLLVLDPLQRPNTSETIHKLNHLIEQLFPSKSVPFFQYYFLNQ